MGFTNPVRHPPLSDVGIALALTMACMHFAHSTEVNKCIVDGKTAYQEAPCANGGKVLKLNKEIPKEQVWEANRRASEDWQRSTNLELSRKNAEFQEQARAANERQERERRAAMDCGRLAKEGEAAEGQLARARPSPMTRAINREKDTVVSEQVAKAESEAIDKAVGEANARLIRAKMNQKNAGC
jgi:hypothetical protein